MPKEQKTRRKFPRRWPMLRLMDALITRMPTPKTKNGIAILRMFGIGDALLFRAVLEKYAEALGEPLSRITVLGSTAWAPVAPFFKNVTVILIDERRFAKNFLYRFRVMHNLRKHGFKTAICGMRLRNPLVVESLMLASGADQTIIASPRPDEKFDRIFAYYAPHMTHVVMQREADRPRMADGTPLPLMHEITQQLMFLSAIAGREIGLDALPKLAPPAKSKDLLPQVQDFASSPQAGRNRYAILNIGASYAPRRWPLKSFMEIAERLARQGWSVTILGGPAEEDLKNEIATLVEPPPPQPSPQGGGSPASTRGNGRITFSINELDFTQATQLIANADLVVSNDSGLGHLSIMLEKPTVILLGGGHYGSFMPYPAHLTPAHVRFLTHPMPCYHCNWNCTQMPPGGKTFPCVSEIAVDQAWQAVMEIQN